MDHGDGLGPAPTPAVAPVPPGGFKFPQKVSADDYDIDGAIKALNPDDYDLPPTSAAQTSENADVGAQHALDQPQEKAAKALQAPDPKAMQNGIRSALNEAPPVAEYAARSKDHAAAIGLDSAQLAAFHAWMGEPIDSSQQSSWERWFSGPQALRAPNEEERALAHENGLPEPSGVQLRPVGHGLFMASILQGVQSAATSFRELGTDVMNLISRHPGPHSPGEYEAGKQRELLRTASEQALQQRGQEVAQLGGADSWASKAVSAIPALGALAVAPEAVAPGLLFAQSYGSLRASGVEPGYAFAGGLTGALIGAGVGQKFIAGLALRETAQTAQQAAAQTLTSLLLKPGWQQLGESFGAHFASGWGMATGMGIADEAARMADHYAKTGEVPDSSELMTRFGQIAKDATTVAPFAAFGAYGEYHAQQGRYLRARAGDVELRGLSDLVNSAHLADSNPEVLKDILRYVIDTRRVTGQLDVAAQTAEGAGAETAPALRQAANAKRGELRAYVSNDAFVRAAKAMGVEPADLVRRVTQNDGQSWSDAQIMGIPISMKLENFLVGMKDAHETAISGTTLDPAHPPLDDVRKEEPVELPPQGTVRFYHGGAGDPTSGGPRWVSRSRAYAEGYAAKSQGVVHYVDVPEDHPAMRAQFEDLQDLNATPGIIKAPYGNWGVPEELAKKLKPAGLADFPELSTRLDNAKLNEIAARGGAGDAAPSRQELLDAYGRLQTLGFQLPALPEVKVEGLGSQPANAPEPKPNYKARAEEYVAGRTLGQLDTDQHARADKNAQTEMKRLSLKAVEDLAKATASAQGSVETKDPAKFERSTTQEVKAGDKMQEYAAAERQYKLNSAIEKARQAAVDAGQKIAKAISSHDTDGARGRFYAGGQGTGSLSDLILQSIGKAPRDIPLSLEDAYGHLLADGMTPTFDPQKLADLIDKPRGLEDMTLEDAKNVKTALDNLKATAKRNAESQTKDRTAKRLEVISTDIRPAAQAGAKGPAVIESIANLLKPTRLGNLLGADADYANFGTLMQPWGKWGEQMRSARISARNNESKLFEDMEKSNVMDLPPELKKTAHEPIKWPTGMQADYGFEPSRKDAWKALAMTGTEEGLNSISKSWGISPEAVHSWLFDQVGLTKAETDFVQKHWDHNEKWGDLISATKSNAGGTPLTRQTRRDITTPDGQLKGGYSPFKWLDKNGVPYVPDPDSADAHGLGSEVSHGFTIDRTKEGQPGDRPDVRWDNMPAHYRAEAHYITHYDFVRELHGMLTDPDFRQTVLDTRGPEWLSRMRDSYVLMKDGRAQYDTNASAIMTDLVQPVRRAAAAAAFNLNFPVTLGQLAHPLVTKSALGLSYADLAKGMYELAKGDGWAFAEQNSQVVPDRHRDSFRSVTQNIGELAGAPGASRLDVLNRPGHLINESVDTTIARLGFLSQYYKHLPFTGHDEAVRISDLGLEKIMPARTVLDQSKVVRDQRLGLYLLVRNFPNTIWNINAMDAWDTRAGMAQTGLVKGYGGLISRRMGQIAGLGFGMYLMGHGRNEEEQENGAPGFGQAAARTLLTEGVYGNLITHELMRSFAPLGLGEHFNPWSLKLFETPIAGYVHGLLADAGKFAGGDTPERALASLDALSKALGFNQLGKSGAGAKTVFIDKDFQNYGEAGSDLFYGPRKDATPLTDIGQFSRSMAKRFGTPDPLRRH